MPTTSFVPLPLPEDEVHVWVARPPLLDIERLHVHLSHEEHARARRFRFERHRREHIATRALVRTTLSRYRPVPPHAWVWKLGEYGKPSPDPPCGVFFNASNHPGLVACGVARSSELGIDVEPRARGDEILDVARDVFSSPELRALYALEGERRLERAVSLWTAKEAYIKARGWGFSAPLREIFVDFDAERPVVRFLTDVDTEDGWYLELVDVHAFRLAVAVRASVVVRGSNERPRLVVREAPLA